MPLTELQTKFSTVPPPLAMQRVSQPVRAQLQLSQSVVDTVVCKGAAVGCGHCGASVGDGRKVGDGGNVGDGTDPPPNAGHEFVQRPPPDSERSVALQSAQHDPYETPPAEMPPVMPHFPTQKAPVWHVPAGAGTGADGA